MKYLSYIILPVLFVNICCKSGIEVVQTGTYVFAAICADGIVVATDSRNSFIDNRRLYAYIDRAEKIYQDENTAIVFVGQYSSDSNTIGALLKAFASKRPTNLRLDQYYRAFSTFLKDRDSQLYRALNELNYCFIAGYSAKPIIYRYYRGEVDSLITHGYITSDSREQISPKLSQLMGIRSVKLMQGIIGKYVADKCKIENEAGNLLSGGPPSVAIIQNGQLKWEARQTYYKHLIGRAMAEAFLTGGLKMDYFKTSQDSVLFMKQMELMRR